MKLSRITTALLLIATLIACKKKEVAEQPPIATLTTGTWNIEQVQYTSELPGYFTTLTSQQVMGTVNFTFDSLYLSFTGMAVVADSVGNLYPVPLEDDRYGRFTVISDDKFSIVDLQDGQLIEYEGLGRSDNAMHLTYDIKSTWPVSLDSVVQIKETYILKLSRE